MSDSAADLAARWGPTYRWLVAITGMTGLLGMVLSMTAVNVAVPDVMGAFGIGQDKAQWMASGYSATMTAGMLFSAWIVGVLGERWVFIGALVFFSLGAVLAGTSTDISMLIVGRVMQGFTAGVGQPLVMASIFSAFPPERRGSAMGIFGLGIVFAPAIGPTLGGMMIEAFSWRWVFFLSLPFCAIGVVMSLLFMPTRALPTRIPRFDWIGFILICTALLGLMTGVADGQSEGWSSDTIVFRLVLGFACAIGFVLWELRMPTPLLEIRIFSNLQFSSATFIAFVFGLSMMSSTYLFPVFVQTVQGFTPLDAGLLLMPAGVMLAVLFPLTGRLSDFIPPGMMIMLGLVLFFSASEWMSTGTTDTGFWTLVLMIMLSRLGLGFINPPLNTSALKALPPERLRQASSGVNFFRQLGGAFGTNLAVAFLETRTRYHADALTATQHWGNHSTDQMLEHVRRMLETAGIHQQQSHAAALDFLGQVVHAQSQAIGFQDTFTMIGLVALAGVVPTIMLSLSQRRKASGGLPAAAPAE